MIDPLSGFKAPECTNEALGSFIAGTGCGATAATGRDNARPLLDASARPPRFSDVEEPIEALLLWAFALRDQAPRELCHLLGISELDEELLSDAQRRQLTELRATRVAEELFSREELGQLLRTRLGLLLGRCDNARDFERLSRAAQRMPVWVFNPELAALEDQARTARATETRMLSELARGECKARKAEAKARVVESRAAEAIAAEAIAEPRLFSSSKVKVACGSEAVFEHGVRLGRAQLLDEQAAAGPPQQGLPAEYLPWLGEAAESFRDPASLEECLLQARQMISMIEADLEYNRSQDEAAALAVESNDRHDPDPGGRKPVGD